MRKTALFFVFALLVTKMSDLLAFLSKKTTIFKICCGFILQIDNKVV